MTYRPGTGPLAGAGNIALHWAVNGWRRAPQEQWPGGSSLFIDGVAVQSPMVRRDDESYVIEIPTDRDTRILNFVLTDGLLWDNNSGRDYALILDPEMRGELPDFSSFADTFDIHFGDNPAIEWDRSMFPEMTDDGVVFRFPDIGYSWIEITGDFAEWKRFQPLVRYNDHYYAVVRLPDGTHQYKYRMSPGWLPDPNNPDMVDDGYAGFNSVIRIADREVLPPREQQVFDRRTESRSILFIWRSQDFREAEVRAAVNEMENIASCLREYLIARRPFKVTIFYRSIQSRHAGGVTVGDKIWITMPGLNLSAIAHELTHHIRPAPNSLMSEGLAMLMQTSYDLSTYRLHADTREAIEQGRYIPLTEVLNAGFIKHPDLRVLYSESGSFVAYLIAVYGRRNVLLLYEGYSPETALGKSLTDLESDWKNWLKSF
jgi:hypothetical protein